MSLEALARNLGSAVSYSKELLERSRLIEVRVYEL